jgi:hypothetical protein
MGFTAQEIDRIVREVVRRLESASTPGNTQPAPASAAEKHESRDRLLLSTPVISVARLEGKLTGIKQVVVPPNAVVTPAAKDLLRENKIVLLRGEVSRQGKAPSQILVAGVAETAFEPAALWQEIQREKVHIERLARTGLGSVTAELCERVGKGGWLGLLLTSQVAAAACLANRTPGIRAAEARCATSTRDAVRSLGVNLLVVNPSGKSTFELKRMISIFLAGGGHCPTEWQGKLN